MDNLKITNLYHLYGAASQQASQVNGPTADGWKSGNEPSPVLLIGSSLMKGGACMTGTVLFVGAASRHYHRALPEVSRYAGEWQRHLRHSLFDWNMRDATCILSSRLGRGTLHPHFPKQRRRELRPQLRVMFVKLRVMSLSIEWVKTTTAQIKIDAVEVRTLVIGPLPNVQALAAAVVFLLLVILATKPRKKIDFPCFRAFSGLIRPSTREKEVLKNGIQGGKIHSPRLRRKSGDLDSRRWEPVFLFLRESVEGGGGGGLLETLAEDVAYLLRQVLRYLKLASTENGSFDEGGGNDPRVPCNSSGKITQVQV